MKTSLILPPSLSHVATEDDLDLFDVRGMFGAQASFERGTNTQGDVLTQTIDGRPLNEMWAEFQRSLGMWNEARSALVQALTFPVSNPVEDVPIYSGDEFEEASEFGEPKGLRGGAYHSLGYDFKWYDLAVRYTWQYLAEATGAQVESLNNMALEADNRLVFSKIMKAIFAGNTNRAADIRGQSVTVYGFYNNDGTTPPAYKSNTHTSSHNHYIISGGATVVSGDLDDMEEHLVHHGYGSQAGSTLVLLVNRAQLAVIRTFRVATGASYDYVPVTGGAPWLLPTNTGGVVNGSVPTTVNGLTVGGQYGKWLVVEEDYVPSGYMLGFATGGENQATNPVGFRQHANQSLRGLRLVKGRDNDYPLIDSFYNRGFGTGIRHRGAGIVMKIAASGDYTVPSQYA